MTRTALALITGANKGIAFEAARQLDAPGVQILIGARDGQRGADTVSRLQKEGIDARALVCRFDQSRCCADRERIRTLGYSGQ